MRIEVLLLLHATHLPSPSNKVLLVAYYYPLLIPYLVVLIPRPEYPYYHPHEHC